MAKKSASSRPKYRQSSSDSEGSCCSPSSRRVDIVTPAPKKLRTKLTPSEKKKEAEIVKLLMSRRYAQESDDSDSPRRRLFGDDSCDSEEFHELMSYEEVPVWLSSVSASSGYLESITGTDLKDLNRFRKWSKWSSPGIEIPQQNSPVSEGIRLFVKALVRSDLASIKKFSFECKEWIGKTLCTKFGGYKRTLLHAIALHESADFILQFIRFIVPHQSGGTDLTDVYGLTPLHLLVVNSKFSNSSSLDILLRFSSGQVSVRENAAGMTPLHMLCCYSALAKREEIARVVQRLSNGTILSRSAFSEQRYPSMLSISNRNKDFTLPCLEALSSFRPVFDQRDSNGYSLLHIACMEGRSDIVQYLVPRIPFGYRMSKCLLQGTTPLHVAAAGGSPAHAACIQALSSLLKPAEITESLCDNQGWPPLLYALFSESLDTVRECIRLDTQLNDPTWGEGPQLIFSLQLAKRNEAMERLEKLLRLLLTVPEFFDYINNFLRKDISRLSGPLSFILTTIPGGHRLLSIDNKVAYLHYRATAHTRALNQAATVKVVVPRIDTGDRSQSIKWLEGMTCITDSNVYHKGQRLAILYSSRPGVVEEGYGIGPTREFFSIASGIINNHVFQTSPDGRQILPNDDPQMSQSHIAAGALTALALLSSARMSFDKVSKLLWRYILEGDLGYDPDVDKLATWDAEVARSFKWMLENDLTDDVSLVLNEGQDKYKFVYEEVVKRIQPVNMGSFRKGFFSVLDEEWIIDFFDQNELAVVFGEDSENDLDVSEWRAATQYVFCHDKDEVVGWFWDLVASLPKGERRLVLLFATGMTTTPLGGFKAMTTMGGDPMPFTVNLVRPCLPDCPLPTASTCFNMIKLPAYPSREILNQKVMTAIRFGSQGFSFA
jgi:ankyrin repeat protein